MAVSSSIVPMVAGDREGTNFLRPLQHGSRSSLSTDMESVCSHTHLCKNANPRPMWTLPPRGPSSTSTVSRSKRGVQGGLHVRETGRPFRKLCPHDAQLHSNVIRKIHFFLKYKCIPSVAWDRLLIRKLLVSAKFRISRACCRFHD